MRHVGLPPRNEVWVIPCFSAACTDIKNLSTCVRGDAAAEVTYQGATDLHLWEQYSKGINSDSPDLVASHMPELYGITYRLFYEPYIIGATDALPRYDQRFQGRGNDKMEQVWISPLSSRSVMVSGSGSECTVLWSAAAVVLDGVGWCGGGG